MKKLITIMAAMALVAACSSVEAPVDTTTIPEVTTTVVDHDDMEDMNHEDMEEMGHDDADAETEQAIESAEAYLAYTEFSREGLIGQLEFEKYSTEDATFAVDFLGIDWNLQAALMGVRYVELMPFSKDGLTDQLEFEGFTPEQAEYGADAAFGELPGDEHDEHGDSHDA